eukprot:1154886-Pelagomonas_calceolata.AAC.3
MPPMDYPMFYYCRLWNTLCFPRTACEASNAFIMPPMEDPMLFFCWLGFQLVLTRLLVPAWERAAGGKSCAEHAPGPSLGAGSRRKILC